MFRSSKSTLDQCMSPSLLTYIHIHEFAAHEIANDNHILHSLTQDPLGSIKCATPQSESHVLNCIVHSCMILWKTKKSTVFCIHKEIASHICMQSYQLVGIDFSNNSRSIAPPMHTKRSGVDICYFSNLIVGMDYFSTT